MSGSTPGLRKLHAERRRLQIPDDIFRAILLGQTGKESSKGIGMSAANACVAEMRKHRPGDKGPDRKEWRETSKDPLVRKIYKLWGILRNGDQTLARYPDGFVERMVKVGRPDFCTPAQANIVIEGLKDWIEREGLGDKLRK